MKCLATLLIIPLLWVEVWLLGLGRALMGLDPVSLHIPTHFRKTAQRRIFQVCRVEQLHSDGGLMRYRPPPGRVGAFISREYVPLGQFGKRLI